MGKNEKNRNKQKEKEEDENSPPTPLKKKEEVGEVELTAKHRTPPPAAPPVRSLPVFAQVKVAAGPTRKLPSASSRRIDAGASFRNLISPLMMSLLNEEEDTADDWALRLKLFIREEIKYRDIVVNEESVGWRKMETLSFRLPSSSVNRSWNSRSVNGKLGGLSPGNNSILPELDLSSRAISARTVLSNDGAWKPLNTPAMHNFTESILSVPETVQPHEDDNNNNKNKEMIRRSSSTVPLSYGTIRDGHNGFSDYLDSQQGFEFPCADRSMHAETMGHSSARAIHEITMPVFKLDNEDMDGTTWNEYDDGECVVDNKKGESEKLLQMDMTRQMCSRTVKYRILLTLLTVMIFIPTMLYAALFTSVDLLNKVETASVVRRQGSIKSTLLFTDAAAFSATIPLVLLCCYGEHSLRHIVLLVGTSITVGSALCAMFGYPHGVLSLILLSRLLHGVGLAASLVGMLFVHCMELGVSLGTVPLVFTAIHVWLLCSAVGLFLFPVIVRLSSAGVSESLRAYLYTTYAGLVSALGIYVLPLLSVNSCKTTTTTHHHNDRHHISSLIQLHTFLSILRRVDPRFSINGIVCGCFIAVMSLIMEEFDTLLSLTSFTIFTPPVLAGSLLFVALAVLQLCLLPPLGVFVRVCECGPLTFVAAVSLVTLTLVITSSSSSESKILFSPTSTLLLILVTVISSGAALVVSMAALMRSMVAAQQERTPPLAVPAVMCAELFGVCVATAAGVTAAALSVIGDGATVGGQARCVGGVSAVMCIGALFLQLKRLM